MISYSVGILIAIIEPHLIAEPRRASCYVKPYGMCDGPTRTTTQQYPT